MNLAQILEQMQTAPFYQERITAWQELPEREAVWAPFPTTLSAPARRALANAGYTSLDQLAAVREQDLKKLHGMGPKAVGFDRRIVEVASLVVDTRSATWGLPVPADRVVTL